MKRGYSLEADGQQIFPFPDLPPILFSRLRLDIIAIRDRIEMRQDELADAGLFRYLAALSGVQMRGAWTIGGERAIKHRKIGIFT